MNPLGFTDEQMQLLGTDPPGGLVRPNIGGYKGDWILYALGVEREHAALAEDNVRLREALAERSRELNVANMELSQVRSDLLVARGSEED